MRTPTMDTGSNNLRTCIAEIRCQISLFETAGKRQPLRLQQEDITNSLVVCTCNCNKSTNNVHPDKVCNNVSSSDKVCNNVNSSVTMSTVVTKYVTMQTAV